VFGAGYRDSVAVVRVMAAIVPLMVVNAALSTQWMIPHGLDRSLRTVVLSAALLNVLLVLVLTPRFGALGMAWIAVAVEGCIVLGLLWTLKRRGISPWSFARTTGD
jgi:PST family polysaccharide transporter